MGSPVRPEPVDPVAAYLAAKKAPDPVADYLSAKNSTSGFSGVHGASGSWGDDPSFGATMLDAVPFGTKAKALLDVAATGNSYDKNLSSAKLGIEQYRAENPKKALAGTIIGAAAPALASAGTSLLASGEGAAATLAPKIPLIGRILRGAVAGGSYGALQGASQAHGNVDDYVREVEHQGTAGAVFGAATPLVTSTLGAGARAIGLPDKAAGVISNIANAVGTNGKPNRFLAKLAASLGTKGQAAEELAGRASMDAGAPPNVPASPNLPPLALDAGGPNVQGLAENIAKRPGQGQTILRNAVTLRQAQMRPAIAQTLTEGTGVAPDAARSLQPLRDLIQEQSDEANRLYGAARDATRGQPVQSPTLDAILQTPAGKQAYVWAKAIKGNGMSALPQAVNEDAPLLTQLMQMGVPREKALATLGDKVETTEAPDPEVLHLMKQRLAKMAKMGDRGQLDGDVATQAHAINSLWGQVRNELPDVWRQADDAFAKKAQMIEAMNSGRNIFRTQSSPPGTARQAVARSLSSAEVRPATPDAETAFQTGAGMAAQNRLFTASKSIKAPGRIFASSPQVEEQTAQAFQSPEAYGGFQNTLAGWDAAQSQAQRLTGGSPTFPLAAEEANRQSGAATGVLRNLVRGNIGSAATGLAGEALGISSRANRQKLDQAIAEILTRPNRSALEETQLAAMLRQRLTGAGNRLLPRLAASEATSERQF